MELTFVSLGHLVYAVPEGPVLFHQLGQFGPVFSQLPSYLTLFVQLLSEDVIESLDFHAHLCHSVLQSGYLTHSCLQLCHSSAELIILLGEQGHLLFEFVILLRNPSSVLLQMIVLVCVAVLLSYCSLQFVLQVSDVSVEGIQINQFLVEHGYLPVTLLEL